ncbi:efflux RND transporter periplasmic adaptor subunit [Sutcliffiella horikoshii]|nr:efflux RND transporter periplasmic adaptor subunit [Sutcliffiella horikoshii]
MNTKRKKKSKRGPIIWSIIGAVVLIVVLAPMFMPRGTGSIEKEYVQKKDITTYYSFTGTIQAENRKSMSSDKSDRVKEILVKEGDLVKKGDVLLETEMSGEINADMDGEVVGIHTEDGADVMAGAPLIDLADYRDLQAEVKVDEYDLDTVKEKQDVTIEVSALNKEVKGTVASISKEAKNENGVSYFTAIINLEEVEEIRAGMTAVAIIQNQEAKGVKTLSMEAIKFDDQDQPYVLISNNGKETIKKYIELGINDGKRIEVKEGLKEGDAVILSTSAGSQGGFGPGGLPAPGMMGGNQ